MKGKQLRSEEFRLARAKDPSISQGPDCSPDPSAPTEHERQAMQLERPVHPNESAPGSIRTARVTQGRKIGLTDLKRRALACREQVQDEESGCVPCRGLGPAGEIGVNLGSTA